MCCQQEVELQVQHYRSLLDVFQWCNHFDVAAAKALLADTASCVAAAKALLADTTSCVAAGKALLADTASCVVVLQRLSPAGICCWGTPPPAQMRAP